MASKVEVILVAGGQGRRMGGPIPKAFLPLCRYPIFSYALKTFSGVEEISGCILVVPSGEEKRAKNICQQISGLEKVKQIVCGGARRQDSVRCGMDHLSPDVDIVLVHDAVRPFCSAELIRRVITSAEKAGAAVPGIPLADTLKRVDSTGHVAATVDRRSLVAVQTPQGFQFSQLRQAYQNAWEKSLTATDDAGLFEYLGQPVVVVEGEVCNFKITQPYDLQLAEILIRQKKSREEH